MNSEHAFCVLRGQRGYDGRAIDAKRRKRFQIRGDAGAAARVETRDADGLGTLMRRPALPSVERAQSPALARKQKTAALSPLSAASGLGSMSRYRKQSSYQTDHGRFDFLFILSLRAQWAQLTGGVGPVFAVTERSRILAAPAPSHSITTVPAKKNAPATTISGQRCRSATLRKINWRQWKPGIPSTVLLVVECL